MLAGLLIGVFAMLLVWLKLGNGDSGPQWATAKPERPPRQRSEAVNPVTGSTDVAPPKPRFEFFSQLPQREVMVPDEELDDLRETAEQKIAAADHLIQVGSFRRESDAERLKAQLALIGIETSVLPAKMDSGELRYRVRSGPYRSKQRLDETRSLLAENGFQGIIIRMR